jgi:hypothetical protein
VAAYPDIGFGLSGGCVEDAYWRAVSRSVVSGIEERVVRVDCSGSSPSHSHSTRAEEERAGRRAETGEAHRGTDVTLPLE